MPLYRGSSKAGQMLRVAPTLRDFCRLFKATDRSHADAYVFRAGEGNDDERFIAIIEAQPDKPGYVHVLTSYSEGCPEFELAVPS